MLGREDVKVRVGQRTVDLEVAECVVLGAGMPLEGQIQGGTHEAVRPFRGDDPGRSDPLQGACRSGPSLRPDGPFLFSA